METNDRNDYAPTFKLILPISKVLKKNPLYITCYSLTKSGHLTFMGHNTYADAVLWLKKYNNSLMWLYRNTRHIHADFDLETPYTQKQFETLIDTYSTDITKLINSTNSNQLTIELTRKDFQYHTKRDDDGNVISIHIVCLTYKMDYIQQLELHREYNNTRTADEQTADTAIYSNGRAFYSVGSGKVGGMLFNYDPINEYDYRTIWIDNPTSDAQTITYTQPADHFPDDALVDADPIAYIMEHKNKYLRNTNSWIDLMRHVKWSKSLSKQDFCKDSITGKYSYDNNLAMWERETADYVIKDPTQLFNRITSKNIIPQIFTEHFFKTIKATDAERELIKSYKIPKSGDCDFGRVAFNTITGLLRVGGKYSFYYADVEIAKRALTADKYEPIHPLPNARDGFEDKLTEHIQDPNIKYKKYRAKWGVGKSRWVVKPIFELAVKADDTFLALTQTNSNNTQLLNNLKYTDPKTGTETKISSHQDSVFDSKFSVCSIESITKLKNTRPKYLVLDEYVSLIVQFNSITMADKEYKSFVLLMDMIRTAEQVIVLDADLTSKTYTHLLPDDDTPIHELTTSKFNNRVFNIHTKESSFFQLIYNDLMVDKLRTAIASNKRSTSNNLRTKYVALGINTLTINKDGLYINNELHNKTQTKILQSNLDDLIKQHDIQLFIYSPTITTGVSINTEDWFNTQYNIFNRFITINARTALQMTQRVRNITSNTYNILVGKMTKPKPNKTIEDVRAELTADIAIRKQLGGLELEQETNDAFIKSYLISRAEDANSKAQFTFALYELLKEHGLNTHIVAENIDGDESVALGGNLIADYINMKYPTLDDIYRLSAKLSNHETLEYEEDILFSYLKIFLNGVFTHTTETITHDQPINKSSKTRSVKTTKPTTYTFYGIYTYDELGGFMNRRDYAQTIQFRFMDKRNGITEMYHNFNKHQTQDHNPEFYGDTTDNLNKVKQTNIKNIIRIIRAYMSSLENDDGNIPREKLVFTDEIINHLKYIKPARKTPPKKKEQTTDCVLLSNMLQTNRALMSNFGYEYVRYKNVFKKVINPALHHTIPINQLPENIKIAPNTADKYATTKSKKMSVYGVKLVNKYGAKNPARMKELYDAPATLPEHTRLKEYVIKPTETLQNLIKRNNTDEHYPAEHKKTFGIKFFNGKCPSEKSLAVLTDHNPRDENNILTIYANVEKIKNANQAWIKETRDEIADINQKLIIHNAMVKQYKLTGKCDNPRLLDFSYLRDKKERLIRHLETIPRDVIKITNIFKHPIDRPPAPVQSLFDNIIAQTTIFYERPIFSNLRTDYANYPYNNDRYEQASYADKTNNNTPYDDISYKISWDNRPLKQIYAQ